MVHLRAACTCCCMMRMTVGRRLSWHDVVTPVVTLSGNFSELDNADLTQLLQVIADNGVDAFYTGDVARDIIQQVSGLDVVYDSSLEFLFAVFNCFRQRTLTVFNVSIQLLAVEPNKPLSHVAQLCYSVIGDKPFLWSRPVVHFNCCSVYQSSLLLPNETNHYY